MAYNDGPAEVDVNRGLVTSHDSLSEQLKVLAEDITALERVLARALVDGISPLHAKAEQAVNEVRWLRARVQEIDSRVAL